MMGSSSTGLPGGESSLLGHASVAYTHHELGEGSDG